LSTVVGLALFFKKNENGCLFIPQAFNHVLLVHYRCLAENGYSSPSFMAMTWRAIYCHWWWGHNLYHKLSVSKLYFHLVYEKPDHPRAILSNFSHFVVFIIFQLKCSFRLITASWFDVTMFTVYTEMQCSSVTSGQATFLAASTMFAISSFSWI
jgi:hypothetical protein